MKQRDTRNGQDLESSGKYSGDQKPKDNYYREFLEAKAEWQKTLGKALYELWFSRQK